MSIEITNVRNARSLNLSNTCMDVEIEHPTYGWIPYTITDTDTDGTINNDNLMSLIGSDFEAYVPPTQAELDAEAAAAVRGRRDSILVTEVDPIVSNPLRWGSLTDQQQLAYTVYRQSLLDITDQEGFPHNVVWPDLTEV